MQLRAGLILLAILLAASLLCSAAAVFLHTRSPVPSRAAGETVSARGILRSIDAASGAVMIKHEAIHPFGMPNMTMLFVVSDPQLLEGRAAGEEVSFTLAMKDGAMLVVDLRPAPARSPSAR